MSRRPGPQATESMAAAYPPPLVIASQPDHPLSQVLRYILPSVPTTAMLSLLNPWLAIETAFAAPPNDSQPTVPLSKNPWVIAELSPRIDTQSMRFTPQETAERAPLVV